MNDGVRVCVCFGVLECRRPTSPRLTTELNQVAEATVQHGHAHATERAKGVEGEEAGGGGKVRKRSARTGSEWSSKTASTQRVAITSTLRGRAPSARSNRKGERRHGREPSAASRLGTPLAATLVPCTQRGREELGGRGGRVSEWADNGVGANAGRSRGRCAMTVLLASRFPFFLFDSALSLRSERWPAPSSSPTFPPIPRE